MCMLNDSIPPGVSFYSTFSIIFSYLIYRVLVSEGVINLCYLARVAVLVPWGTTPIG